VKHAVLWQDVVTGIVIHPSLATFRDRSAAEEFADQVNAHDPGSDEVGLRALVVGPAEDPCPGCGRVGCGWGGPVAWCPDKGWV